MTFNPPLSDIAYEPLPRTLDEHYILRRDNVNIELIYNNDIIISNGNIYLTSLRLIFIPDILDNFYGGLEIILATTHLEFNQPIFGTNYLSGRLDPLPNGLDQPSDFKIYFKNGSSATFASIFTPLLEIVKSNYLETKKAVQRQRLEYFDQNAPNMPSIDSYEVLPMPPPIYLVRPLLNEGLIDPNDPTILYVLQPTMALKKSGGI